MTGDGDRLQRLVIETVESWLWRQVTKAGCGDRLQRLVMETGYEGWLWRQVMKAGH